MYTKSVAEFVASLARLHCSLGAEIPFTCVLKTIKNVVHSRLAAASSDSTEGHINATSSSPPWLWPQQRSLSPWSIIQEQRITVANHRSATLSCGWSVFDFEFLYFFFFPSRFCGWPKVSASDYYRVAFGQSAWPAWQCGNFVANLLGPVRPSKR